MAGPIDDVDALTDDAREQRAEPMTKALDGEAIEAPEKVEKETTIDLEAAFLASVGATESKATAKPKAKSTTKRAKAA